MIEALERFESTHGVVSEELNDRPEIPLSLEWIWAAFATLSASRTSGGFGPSPIQLSEILAYCGIFDIRDTEVRELCSCVMAMDIAFLAWANKRSDGSGNS